MGMQAWAREMARYNQWQNQALFALTDPMGDVERKSDRGLFFHSIHRTLDHILMVDTRLAGMVETGQRPDEPFQPEKTVHTDYAQLSKARREMDMRLLTLADGHDDDWFDDVFEFASPISGQQRKLPRHFYLVQLFNHATHHRSQVTACLHGMGVDYGVTDLPMNPLSIYEV